MYSAKKNIRYYRKNLFLRFFSQDHYYYLCDSLTVVYISMLTIYCPVLHFFTLFFTFFVCLCSLISPVSRRQIFMHKLSLLSNIVFSSLLFFYQSKYVPPL